MVEGIDRSGAGAAGSRRKWQILGVGGDGVSHFVVRSRDHGEARVAIWHERIGKPLGIERLEDALVALGEQVRNAVVYRTNRDDMVTAIDAQITVQAEEARLAAEGARIAAEQRAIERQARLAALKKASSRANLHGRARKFGAVNPDPKFTMRSDEDQQQ